jgi:hypothetical protein
MPMLNHATVSRYETLLRVYPNFWFYSPQNHRSIAEWCSSSEFRQTERRSIAEEEFLLRVSPDYNIASNERLFLCTTGTSSMLSAVSSRAEQVSQAAVIKVSVSQE